MSRSRFCSSESLSYSTGHLPGRPVPPEVVDTQWLRTGQWSIFIIIHSLQVGKVLYFFNDWRKESPVFVFNLENQRPWLMTESSCNKALKRVCCPVQMPGIGTENYTTRGMITYSIYFDFYPRWYFSALTFDLTNNVPSDKWLTSQHEIHVYDLAILSKVYKHLLKPGSRVQLKPFCDASWWSAWAMRLRVQYDVYQNNRVILEIWYEIKPESQ